MVTLWAQSICSGVHFIWVLWCGRSEVRVHILKEATKEHHEDNEENECSNCISSNKDVELSRARAIFARCPGSNTGTNEDENDQEANSEDQSVVRLGKLKHLIREGTLLHILLNGPVTRSNSDIVVGVSVIFKVEGSVVTLEEWHTIDKEVVVVAYHKDVADRAVTILRHINEVVFWLNFKFVAFLVDNGPNR